MVAVAMVLALQMLPPLVARWSRGLTHSRPHKHRSCLSRSRLSVIQRPRITSYDQGTVKYKHTQGHNQLQAYKSQSKQAQVQRTSNRKLTQRRTDHNQIKNAINQHSILEEVNICLTFGGGDHVFLCSFPLSHQNPEQQRALSSCSPVFPFPRSPKS
jgi:hypothetical protein